MTNNKTYSAKGILADRNKTLIALENLEIDTIDTEKEARIDVAKCIPSKLFNLIAKASMYRAITGAAEELYPGDLNIKEHIKSSRHMLIDKTLELTSRFEKDCNCKAK